MKLKMHDENVQHEFDAFCKKVLRNEARDYYDELARKRNREIMFSDLPVEVLQRLSIYDKHFKEDKSFRVYDYVIYIDNDELAEALSALSDKKRSIILLYYFLGMTDYDIAKCLNAERRAITYNRTSAIKLLKELMGG